MDRGAEKDVRPLASPQAAAVFEILVREYSGMLEVYLRAIMGRDSSIDDVFQECMMVAWRRLDAYDRTRPFGPWLRGIAHKLVLEHMRRGRTRPRATDPEVLSALDHCFETFQRGAGDSFGERAERVLECLAKLPASMREAIELVYIRHTPAHVAATVVDAGREAFWKRVQRGRQLIAQCLGVVAPDAGSSGGIE